MLQIISFTLSFVISSNLRWAGVLVSIFFDGDLVDVGGAGVSLTIAVFLFFFFLGGPSLKDNGVRFVLIFVFLQPLKGSVPELTAKI